MNHESPKAPAPGVAYMEAVRLLWLVGRYRGPERPHDEPLLVGDPPGVLAPWEYMGIFTTREKAVAACTLRIDFVAPVPLDERSPDEQCGFEDAFYPLTEDLAAAPPEEG